MSILRKWALASLLAGLGVLAYAAIQGDLRVGLFLIFPFIMGQGALPFVGFLLLMGAMVLFFLGSVRPPPTEEWTWKVDPPEAADEPEVNAGGARSRHGGVVLLGPIPIVWGSDRKVLPWMIAAGAALLVLSLLVSFLLQ